MHPAAPAGRFAGLRTAASAWGGPAGGGTERREELLMFGGTATGTFNVLCPFFRLVENLVFCTAFIAFVFEYGHLFPQKYL